MCIRDREKVKRFLDSPKDYGKPWYGQLMAGPQTVSYTHLMCIRDSCRRDPGILGVSAYRTQEHPFFLVMDIFMTAGTTKTVLLIPGEQMKACLLYTSMGKL